MVILIVTLSLLMIIDVLLMISYTFLVVIVTFYGWYDCH